MKRLHISKELDDELRVVKAKLRLGLWWCWDVLSGFKRLRVDLLDQIELLFVENDLTASTRLRMWVRSSVSVPRYIRRLALERFTGLLGRGSRIFWLIVIDLGSFMKCKYLLTQLLLCVVLENRTQQIHIDAAAFTLTCEPSRWQYATRLGDLRCILLKIIILHFAILSILLQ